MPKHAQGVHDALCASEDAFRSVYGLPAGVGTESAQRACGRPVCWPAFVGILGDVREAPWGRPQGGRTRQLRPSAGGAAPPDAGRRNGPPPEWRPYRACRSNSARHPALVGLGFRVRPRWGQPERRGCVRRRSITKCVVHSCPSDLSGTDFSSRLPDLNGRVGRSERRLAGSGDVATLLGETATDDLGVNHAASRTWLQPRCRAADVALAFAGFKETHLSRN